MAQMVKSIFNPGSHTNLTSAGLLLLRIITGAFMLTHGYGKLVRLFGDDPIKFADPFGIGPGPSLALAVLAEFFCSILVMLGLGTRISVIPLIITMLVAAFFSHAADPFGSKELALLYCTIFIIIGITGSGRFSIDNFLFRR